jgi:hypothetical protein
MGLYHGMRGPAFVRSASLFKIAATVAIAAGIAFLSGAAGARELGSEVRVRRGRQCDVDHHRSETATSRPNSS